MSLTVHTLGISNTVIVNSLPGSSTAKFLKDSADYRRQCKEGRLQALRSVRQLKPKLESKLSCFDVFFLQLLG